MNSRKRLASVWPLVWRSSLPALSGPDSIRRHAPCRHQHVAVMIPLVALAARFMDVKISRDAVGIGQMPGDGIAGSVQASGGAQFHRGMWNMRSRAVWALALKLLALAPRFPVALPQLGGVPQLRPVPRP